MTGVDDIHRDQDRAGVTSEPRGRAELTDEQFLAAAAAQDARVMAATMPGVVVVHTNLDDVVADVRARQAEMARRDGDPRTADQMRAEVGGLLQRFYDARWYGGPDDIERTRAELGQVLRETQHRLGVPAEFIGCGAYVRAVGEDPSTGRATSVSGVVVAATHTARRPPGDVTGEECGVHFVIAPPQREGHRSASYDVFVAESVPLIVLPAPIDRGRPAWMAQHPTTTAARPAAAGVADPAPVPAGPAHPSRSPVGGARPFPRPDRIDAAIPPPGPAPMPPTAPLHDHHR